MKSIKLSDFTKDEYIIAAARASSPARLEELLRIAAVLDSDPHKTIINPTSLQETLQNLYDKKNFAMQQEVALAVQALNISSQINYARTDFDNAKPYICADFFTDTPTTQRLASVAAANELRRDEYYLHLAKNLAGDYRIDSLENLGIRLFDLYLHYLQNIVDEHDHRVVVVGKTCVSIINALALDKHKFQTNLHKLYSVAELLLAYWCYQPATDVLANGLFRTLGNTTTLEDFYNIRASLRTALTDLRIELNNVDLSNPEKGIDRIFSKYGSDPLSNDAIRAEQRRMMQSEFALGQEDYAVDRQRPHLYVEVAVDEDAEFFTISCTRRDTNGMQELINKRYTISEIVDTQLAIPGVNNLSLTLKSEPTIEFALKYTGELPLCVQSAIDLDVDELNTAARVELNSQHKVMLNKNLAMAGSLSVLASTITQSANVHAAIHNGCVLKADNLELHGAIDANGKIKIIADRDIEYTLENLTSGTAVHLQLPHARYLQLDEEINGSVIYEILQENSGELVLSQQARFSGSLYIIAPHCNAVISGRIMAYKKIYLHVKNINVSDNGLFANGMIGVKAQGGTVGYLDFNSVGVVDFGQKIPSREAYIAAEQQVFLDIANKLEIHAGTVTSLLNSLYLCSGTVDNIAGNIYVYLDTYLAMRHFDHRLLFTTLPTGEATMEDAETQPGAVASRRYRTRGVKVVTNPASFTTLGCVYLGHDANYGQESIAITGSCFYFNQHRGTIPIVAHNILQENSYRFRNTREEWVKTNEREILGILGRRVKVPTYPVSDGKLQRLHRKEFNAVLESGGDLDASLSGNVSGTIVARQAMHAASVNNLEIGVSDRAIDLRNLIIDNTASMSREQSLLFAHDSEINFTPIYVRKTGHVYQTLAGRLQAECPLGFEYDLPLAMSEKSRMFSAFSEKLGVVDWTGLGMYPEEALNTLKDYTLQWFTENPAATSGVTSEHAANLKMPLIIYKCAANSQLNPEIILPDYMLLLKNRLSAGGLFAKILQIDFKASTTLYGFLNGSEKLSGEVEDLIIERRTFDQQVLNTEIHSSSSFLSGTKIRQHQRRDTVRTLQPGAELSGGAVELTINELAVKGGNLTATKGDLIIHSHGVNLDTASGVYYVENTSSDGTILKHLHIHEYLERKIMAATTLTATGNVLIDVQDGDLLDIGAQIKAKNINLVVVNGKRISHCAVVTEQQGTKVSRNKLTVTKTQVAQEKAFPSMFVAQDELRQTVTGGTMELNATVQMAEHIVLLANGFGIKSFLLNKIINSQTSGIVNYTTYINSRTQVQIQSALTPKFSFKTLVIEASDGDIELQSAELYGSNESTFRAKAAKGNVEFTTVKPVTTSTTTSRSVGVSFGGSAAIAAAIDGGFKDSLISLGKEVGLLQPLISMCEGGQVEDYMAQGMLFIHRFTESVKQGHFDSLGNFTDQMLGSFGFARNDAGKMEFSPKNMKFSLTFTETKKNTFSNEVLPNILAVFDTVIEAASNVNLHSVQVDGETLNINAGGDICLVADKEESKNKQTSKSLSVSTQKGDVSVGVGIEKSQESSCKNITTMYKLNKAVNLVAKGDIALRGTLVETAQAFVEAKRVMIETLLDEHKMRYLQASVSTDGNVGFSNKNADEKWANLQAGIHASAVLYINAQEQLDIRGGVLKVASNAQPFVLADGKKLYEIAMPKDGDALFHALGVSRIKAAADLLAAVNNEAIRKIVANDITRLLKAGQLPSIMAQTSEVIELLREFKALQASDDSSAIDEKIAHYSVRDDVFREFVTFFVNVEGSNLSFNLCHTHELCTIDAIAELNNLSIKTWSKDAEQLKIIHEYQPTKLAREVDLRLTCTDLNSGGVNITYSLLTDNPEVLLSPVVTHAAVTGYKHSSGISLSAGGLFNLSSSDSDNKNRQQNAKNNPYIVGTMFRSDQDQINNAALINELAQANILRPDGSSHDLTGIAQTANQAQITGETDRFGFGMAASSTLWDLFKNKDQQNVALGYSAGDNNESWLADGNEEEQEEEQASNAEEDKSTQGVTVGQEVHILRSYVDKDGIRHYIKVSDGDEGKPAKPVTVSPGVHILKRQVDKNGVSRHVKVDNPKSSKGKTPKAKPQGSSVKVVQARSAKANATNDDEDKKPSFWDFFHDESFTQPTDFWDKPSTADYDGYAVDGMKQGIIELSQGVKQIGLQLGEKVGLASKEDIRNYTATIAAQKKLYEASPAAQTLTAKLSKFSTEALVYALPIGGAGVSGYKLWAANTAMCGAAAALQPIYEPANVSWSYRGERALWGAAIGGAVGGAVPALAFVGTRGASLISGASKQAYCIGTMGYTRGRATYTLAKSLNSGPVINEFGATAAELFASPGPVLFRQIETQGSRFASSMPARGNAVYNVEKGLLFSQSRVINSSGYKISNPLPCPSGIFNGWQELSDRQVRILDTLPKTGSVTIIKKSDINVTDLAALTARTDHEFAIFTLGSRRLIMRGDKFGIELNDIVMKLKNEGWRWSAHTHPGNTPATLIPSGLHGDLGVLNVLSQEQSMIVNSSGKRSIFYGEGGYDPIASTSITTPKL